MTKMGEATEPHKLLTHYELEDLLTTWGGYDKFPLRAHLCLQVKAHPGHGRQVSH